jgi:hypothetical protein
MLSPGAGHCPKVYVRKGLPTAYCVGLFIRKVDVERHLASVEGAKLSGSYVDTSNTITVTQKAREWAATRPHRASTAAHTKSLINTHIAPTAPGAMRLSAVRSSHVQAWVTDRSRVLSPGTLRAVAGLLRSVFNAAVLDRLIASSPAVRLSLPGCR